MKLFRRSSSLILLLIILSFSSTLNASPPQTISYQGYLKDGAGKPVITPVKMVFSLYSSTRSNSGAIWIETNNSVPVNNGVYSITLGNNSTLNLPFDRQYFLGVTVGSDPEITPRQPLTSVPTAFRASIAESVNGYNTGTGPTGNFVINNAGNNNPAVSGSTNGIGPAVSGFTTGSGAAVSAQTNGTGIAGWFSINNPASSNAAVFGSTNGSGPAVNGNTTGTGNAGAFTINNAANINSALYSQTNGTGAAVNGNNTGTGNAGIFTINNATNNKAAVYASTNGTGTAGSYNINNTANTLPALTVNSNGSGPSIYSENTGTGQAAFFRIINASSTVSVLYATTDGNGNSGYFLNTGTGGGATGGHAGIFETNNAANSKAVLYATGNGSGSAIYGYSTGTARAGRFEINNAASTADALYVTTNGTGNAANLNGNVAVSGTMNIVGALSKGSGTFKIDHPLDPKNRYLLHSFVESPDMMNIYNGNVVTDVQGYATVTMPEWFGALNREFRYQLTVLDDGDSADFIQAKVVRKLAGNTFTIRTSKPGTEVSWQVTGVRHDPYAENHRIQVEVEKPDSEKGTCLYPEACTGH